MERVRLCDDLGACRLSVSHYRPPMPENSPPLTPDALAKMSDQELITVWSNTTWDDGDPAMDALAVEVERRGLDF